MLDFLGAAPATVDNLDDGQLNWSDLTTTLGDLAPGQSLAVVVRFRAMQATTHASLAAAAGLAAVQAEPAVDGRLDSNYTYLGESAATNGTATGSFYGYQGASMCYWAFVMDRRYNSNVYSSSDTAYLKLDGQTVSQHKFGDLVGSDNFVFNVTYPGGSRTGLTLDLLKNTVSPFSSGQTGGDGSAAPGTPPIANAMTSLHWNMENSGWASYLTQSPPYNYNQTSGKYWEWNIIYEFALPKSSMGGACGSVAIASAHTSPAKYSASLGVIGDRVWADADRDGVQDTGELGLPGVVVNLYQGTTLVRTTATDPGPTGEYIFSNLPAGTYTVNVDESTLPVNYTLTSANEPKTVTIPAGGADLSADFGYWLAGTATIGDRVYYDLNGDGGLDNDGEPGLPGVTVRLYKGACPATGALWGTLVTGPNGAYDFTFLPADTYCVDVDETTLPAGFGLTTAPEPLTVVLTNGQDYNLADFGYRVTACENGTPNLTAVSGAVDSVNATLPDYRAYACAEIEPARGVIGDFVWFDTNGNGIEEVGEPGIANVKLALHQDMDGTNTLTPADLLVTTTRTDADGGYAFHDVKPGVYFVEVLDAASPALTGLIHTLNNQSQPDPTGAIVMTAGRVYKDADFGYRKPLDPGMALVGDTVWYDGNGDGFQQPGEPGIPNVKVVIRNVSGAVLGSAWTDNTGFYLVVVPAGFGYTAAPDPTTVPAGLTATTQTTFPLPGLEPGARFLHADFGYDSDTLLTTIGNLVFRDANHNGIFDAGDSPLAGVSVDLIRDVSGGQTWDDGEPIIATVTTASALDAQNGNYLFTGVPAGDYLVHVSDTNAVLVDFTKTLPATPGGDNYSQDDPYPVSLVAGVPDLTADFGYDKTLTENTGVIGNQVWLETDANGYFDPAIQDVGQHGVTVQLLQNNTVVMTTTTGASGDYAFVHLPTGAYSVSVTDQFGVLSRFSTTTYPADQLSDNTNKRQAYQVGLATGGFNPTADFGYLCRQAFGGRLWMDMDRDGVQDINEPGLVGIEVALLMDGARFPSLPELGRTRTDANGYYLFNNVSPGEYVVDVNHGYLGAVLHLFLTTPPEDQVVFVGACESVVEDRGYGPLPPLMGAIGDLVWYDANNNSRQDEWYDANDNNVVDEWLDLNVNGRLDDGEVDKCGIRQVGVTLMDGNGNVLVREHTDHFGWYYFYPLPAGRYIVTVDRTDPDWWDGAEKIRLSGLCKTLPPPFAAAAAEGIAAGAVRSAEATQTVAESVVTLAPTAGEAAIKGQVRSDNDVDGDFTDLEAGLAGAVIELWADANGSTLRDVGDTRLLTTTTDARGFYTFTLVAPGKYIVVENDPTVSTGGSPSFTYGSTKDKTGANDNQNAVTLAPSVDSLGNDFLDTLLMCTIRPNDYVIDLAPGQIFLDADFGAYCVAGPAVIGDFVWYDTDNNGIQDIGEPGIANVRLGLYLDNGDGSFNPISDTLVFTRTTDADGGYLFTGLAPATYFVDVLDATNPNGALRGMIHTSGPQSKTDPHGPITLVPAQVYKDADFGYVRQETNKAIIGDTVWYDGNRDGFQQPGEPGIPGITVCATTVGGGGGVFCATTDANGHYLLPVAAPGSYYVQPTNPPTGFDPTTDPVAGPIVLLAGDQYLDADFGYASDTLLGVIGNLVFLDPNRNGTFDAGDSPLAGVSVDLILDSDGDGVWDPTEPIIATATTTSTLGANNGNYLFSGVPQGNYLVHVSDTNGVLVDYVKTTGPNPSSDGNSQLDPYAVSLPATGGRNLWADFGYYAPNLPDVGVIGNQVWVETANNGLFDVVEQDLGQAGVRVLLLLDGNVVKETTTGASGDYAFVHLPAGTYQVVVSDTLGVLTDVEPSIYPADQTSDNTNKRQPYTITLPLTGRNLTADFGYYNDGPRIRSDSTIGNLIWEDMNADGQWQTGEPAISNVDVQLWFDRDNNCSITPAGGDFLVQSTSTAGSIVAGGNYSFKGVFPTGNYLVTVLNINGTLNGYTKSVGLTPGANNNSQAVPYCIPNFNPLNTNATNLTADFGYWRPAAVGDLVWVDSDSNQAQNESPLIGLGNVQINVYRADTAALAGQATTVSGDYLVSNLKPGVYTVTVAVGPTGYTPTTPTTITRTLSSNQTNRTADFGYTYPTGLALARFEAAGQPGQVELTWAIQGAAPQGFHVLRSDSPKAVAAIQISKQPVLGDAAGAFSFNDAAVEAGRTYWYWLEDAATGQRFGPQEVAVPLKPVFSNQLFLPMTHSR